MNTEQKTIDQLIQEAARPEDPEDKKYVTASSGVCLWLCGLGWCLPILGGLLGLIILATSRAQDGPVSVGLGIGVGSLVSGVLLLGLRAIIMELRYIRQNIEAR